MTNPFIQTTPDQLREMLETVGADSVDSIFRDQIPQEYECGSALDLPPALAEPELQREFLSLASRNTSTRQAVSFLGGGVYDHFIPSAVGAIANRSEFVTAYTPYQPEASQGTLQAFFEFQTMVTRLFDMDVANASLYDGASALGEALFLALQVRPERRTVLVPAALHPDYAALAETYLRHFDIRIQTIPVKDGATDLGAMRTAATNDVAAIVLQQPNYLGCIEDAPAFSAVARDCGALLIAVCDPISLGVLAPPGAWGADIAVAEGQPLGLRQFLGGESLGLFAVKKDFMRRVPGRLVGLTKDREGRRGFVLTLQTREQHIRRDKATSNICTNHAHNALRATIYMALMGPRGLERVARACVRNSSRLRRGVAAARLGAVAFAAPTFKEFVVRTARPAVEVREALLAKGLLAGTPLGCLGPGFEDKLLVCTTECRTDDEIDRFVAELKPYL